MKKYILFAVFLLAITAMLPGSSQAQAPTNRVVHVVSLRTKWPENGSRATRDSLVAFYNTKVIAKNEFILSHREYSHMYTNDARDYMIIEEFADLASMEKANERNQALEKELWPTDADSKAFFDKLDQYFENWHGDALYGLNPSLSKN